MLRSFDYVAGACGDTPGAREWARACRDAFLEGYRDRAGHDATRQNLLLDAFELDKALYEAVYEARNRPSWLAIPIAAARRLASAVED
jgi:predicted trehalose synthase